MSVESVSAERLLEIVREELPECPAYCEQTGGGCATLFLGTARGMDPTPPSERDAPDDDDPRYWLAIGPGAYDWGDPSRSEFSYAELYVGPDDMGDLDSLTVESEQEFREALRHFRSIPDWRLAPAV